MSEEDAKCNSPSVEVIPFGPKRNVVKSELSEDDKVKTEFKKLVSFINKIQDTYADIIIKSNRSSKCINLIFLFLMAINFAISVKINNIILIFMAISKIMVILLNTLASIPYLFNLDLKSYTSISVAFEFIVFNIIPVAYSLFLEIYLITSLFMYLFMFIIEAIEERNDKLSNLKTDLLSAHETVRKIYGSDEYNNPIKLSGEVKSQITELDSLSSNIKARFREEIHTVISENIDFSHSGNYLRNFRLELTIVIILITVTTIIVVYI